MSENAKDDATFEKWAIDRDADLAAATTRQFDYLDKMSWAKSPYEDDVVAKMAEDIKKEIDNEIIGDLLSHYHPQAEDPNDLNDSNVIAAPLATCTLSDTNLNTTAITITDSSNGVLVSIARTGEVTLGKNISPEFAAHDFWHKLAELGGKFEQQLFSLKTAKETLERRLAKVCTSLGVPEGDEHLVELYAKQYHDHSSSNFDAKEEVHVNPKPVSVSADKVDPEKMDRLSPQRILTYIRRETKRILRNYAATDNEQNRKEVIHDVIDTLQYIREKDGLYDFTVACLPNDTGHIQVGITVKFREEAEFIVMYIPESDPVEVDNQHVMQYDRAMKNIKES